MSRPRNLSLADIKAALRAGPYAWPGGYPCYFVASDGEALSFEAVRENWRKIVAAHSRSKDAWFYAEWRLVAVDVNYEDPELYCSHSGERIESAYAEPEEVA